MSEDKVAIWYGISLMKNGMNLQFYGELKFTLYCGSFAPFDESCTVWFVDEF